MQLFTSSPVRSLGPIISTTALVGLSAIAVIGITRLMGGPSLAINQVSTQKYATFDVSGESNITAIPDEATVDVGIMVNEPTVAQAQKKINETINTINAKLNELGIEKKDIKTQNYSIYPEYDYQSSSRRVIGYNASTNLLVSIKDFDKLNQVIDQATAAGANTVGGVNFKLSEEKQADLEKQAREEAIEDAKGKAKELSQLAGMRLGKIINVSESPSYQQPIYAMKDMALSSGRGGVAMPAAEPSQIEPGSTTFNYTVTLSYETL